MIISQRDINENVNIRQIRQRSLLSILNGINSVIMLHILIIIIGESNNDKCDDTSHNQDILTITRKSTYQVISFYMRSQVIAI